MKKKMELLKFKGKIGRGNILLLVKYFILFVAISSCLVIAIFYGLDPRFFLWAFFLPATPFLLLIAVVIFVPGMILIALMDRISFFHMLLFPICGFFLTPLGATVLFVFLISTWYAIIAYIIHKVVQRKRMK